MPFFLIRLLNIRTRCQALILIGAAVVLIVVGGVVFAATHHLRVTTGWYWAITTAATVGYGDVTPSCSCSWCAARSTGWSSTGSRPTNPRARSAPCAGNGASWYSVW